MVFVLKWLWENTTYNEVCTLFWETWKFISKTCLPYKIWFLRAVAVLLLFPSLIVVRYFYSKDKIFSKNPFFYWKELLFIYTWVIFFFLIGHPDGIVVIYSAMFAASIEYTRLNETIKEIFEQNNWNFFFKLYMFIGKIGFLLCYFCSLFLGLDPKILNFGNLFMLGYWWVFVFIVYCPYMNYPLAHIITFSVGTGIGIATIYFMNELQFFPFYAVVWLRWELMTSLERRDGYYEFIQENGKVFFMYWFIRALKFILLQEFCAIVGQAWVIHELK